jgi:hypothetical protein
LSAFSNTSRVSMAHPGLEIHPPTFSGKAPSRSNALEHGLLLV